MAETEMQRWVAKAIHESLGYDTPWETCTQCADAARAAIEAMREPTDAMMFAGAGTRNDWRASIDAALQEDTQ